MKKLSVIIPAYNEEKNLKSEVLKEVEGYLAKQKYSYEVIIVDDGSTDKTVETIEKQISKWPNFRLIQNPHGGKALTVMSGLLKAEGEIVLFTDMDQATPLPEVEKFIPQFAGGVDVVIGSRSGRKGAPFVRKMTAWGFILLRNIILGLPFADTQCGFKAFNQKSVQAIFPKLLASWKKDTAKGSAVNAGFDVEVLFFAKKLGFQIVEVGVDWHYVGSERVQFIKDSVEAISGMIKIRINDFRGSYH